MELLAQDSRDDGTLDDGTKDGSGDAYMEE